MVAAERGQGTAEDLLCSEALPLQDTPRGRLKTSSLHRGLPGTTAEARVGRRGVSEEVTLKKSGGLKQHDASTDEVPSVKSKRLSQGLIAFWKLPGAGDGIQGLAHAGQVLSTAQPHPQPCVTVY